MPSIRLIIVTVLAALTPATTLAHSAACPVSELRVMTYNIRLDTDSDGPNRWAKRRNLLIGQIRLIKPAILGLQEVVPGQRADLVSALPDYAVLGGGRDDGKLKGEASPLLVDKARLAVRSNGMFWLSPTPGTPSKGWDAAHPRVATWAHLASRADGMRILAINVHWDHVGVDARRNSARQIRSWIAVHRQPGEAVVLLGDFNAPLAEASLQELVGPSDTLRLADSRTASREPAIGATITFNGWTPLPTTGETIDHVLVGPGLAVKRYHALAETFDGRLASDHFPVVADLVANPGRRTCASHRAK